MKKIDTAPHDVFTEFINGVEEEVLKTQEEDGCHSQPE